MALLKNTKKDSLKQNTINCVLLSVLAVFTAVMCIFGLTMFGEKTIIDGSEADYKAFDSDAVYSFDNMLLLGEYAYYWQDNENNPTDHFYLVAFVDLDYNLYYASLEVNENADIMDACRVFIEYLESDTEEYMDTILTGIFESSKLEAKENDIREEYAVAIGYAAEEFEGVDTGIHFKYRAADEATYKDDAKTDAIVVSVMGGVMTLVCVIGILVCLRQRNKIKEDLARVAAIRADAEVSAEIPETPAVKTEATLNE